jgi:hypothetical protein
VKFVLTIALALGFFLTSLGQESSFWFNSDSLNRKRLSISTSILASTWVGGTYALSKVWYKEFEKTPFHSFNDATDWLQMDKLGHIYTASHLSRSYSKLYNWCGLKPKQSLLIGSALGFGFQTTIELLDAKNSAWGFSWYDMVANGIGTAFFATQELLWNEQNFLLKFSYSPTKFADLRPEVLGNSFSERILKDYNGQIYWLTFSPFSFKKERKNMEWLCVSLGYSANAKLIGDQEEVWINNQVYTSQRQVFFSLDINPEKLNIKRNWVKTLIKPLNWLKFPFPSLELTGRKLSGNWLTY